LNLLPQPQKIRVVGWLPTHRDFEYLNHIRRLEEVTVEYSEDPSDLGIWRSFGSEATPLTLKWSNTDHVPSSDAIRAFESARTPNRSLQLIIDQNRPFSDAERLRLEKSSLPVEWIHEP
jgi:hypothetical protein